MRTDVHSSEVMTCTLRAMASPVILRVVGPGPHARAALERAVAVIREVERTCSRFTPTSPLVRANAAPDRWHRVPETLASAIAEAERAHRETGGLFDPRILGTLLSWGYDRTLPFAPPPLFAPPPYAPPRYAPPPLACDPLGVTAAAADRPSPELAAPWRPEQVTGVDGTRVHLGGVAIDLGGIGKGLAVRWAAAELADAGAGFLVDAGGDCAVGGTAPDGGRWRVGVEDPAGGIDPLLVLELTDSGCATSSIRLRRWIASDAPVHHLVDPRTGRPGGAGLTAATVVAPDPAWAEVLSKTLFLAGAAGIRARAEELELPAAWVGADGGIETSAALAPLIAWSAHRD